MGGAASVEQDLLLKIEEFVEAVDAKGEELTKEEYLQKKADALQMVPPPLLARKDIMCKAVLRFGGSALRWAPPHLLVDREFILQCISLEVESESDLENPVCKFVDSSLLSDKDFVLEVLHLQENPVIFDFATDELRQDADIIRVVVSMHPSYLRYCEVSCRDLVLTAVQRDAWSALQYVKREYLEDREIISAAVDQNPDIFFLLNDSLDVKMYNNDRELMLSAVSRDGRSLRWASEVLRSDKGVVLAAVRSSSDALSYVSTELSNDAEVQSEFRKRLMVEEEEKSKFGEEE